MDRKIVVGVIILILIGVIVAKYYNHTSHPTISTTTSQEDVTVASNSIKEHSNNQTISVTYPQLLHDQNSKVQSQINTNIQQFVNSNISSMQAQIKSFNSTGPSKNPSSEIDGNYTVGEQTNRIISFHFTFLYSAQYFAHPATYSKTLNYNLQTGKNMTLAEIFKPNSNYQTTLATLLKSDLEKRFKDDPSANDFITEGLAKSENIQNFLLTPTSLVIVIDPAIVAPDATGTVQVSIPYSSLQTILNPSILSE